MKTSATLREILSQPDVWRTCFAALDAGQLEHANGQLPEADDWLFVGCGSSYYIALVAAASWTHLTGRRARAVPASEALLFPELAVPQGCQPVLITRSGRTSEILQAAELLSRGRRRPPMAITCTEGEPIDGVADPILRVRAADEQSTVMTRSFTSMLLALQALAALRGGKGEFAAALRALPAASRPALDAMHPRIRRFVRTHRFNNYVFLGQGPYFGAANECMLKVKEMSCSTAQAFHTLEFRHGPKAVVTPQTLVTFLMSETGFAAESQVLKEIRALGARTLVIANRASKAAREFAGLLIELRLKTPEYARPAVYLLAGQLLGYYTGVARGLNPGYPRNLTRSVELG
jgi:glucosamine--fructose-6-phosphate aminotransferase (isomerizing)